MFDGCRRAEQVLKLLLLVVVCGGLSGSGLLAPGGDGPLARQGRGGLIDAAPTGSHAHQLARPWAEHAENTIDGRSGGAHYH